MIHSSELWCGCQIVLKFTFEVNKPKHLKYTPHTENISNPRQAWIHQRLRSRPSTTLDHLPGRRHLSDQLQDLPCHHFLHPDHQHISPDDLFTTRHSVPRQGSDFQAHHQLQPWIPLGQASPFNTLTNGFPATQCPSPTSPRSLPRRGSF